jgi:hypothetical protein
MCLIFVQVLTTNPTQHDPHGPDDPFRTVNYHHLDISGHDGMDERILVGEMAGANEDFGSVVGQMWLIFVQAQQLPIQLSIMIHMDQMILSELSIIIIWTYQDMMEWMSRILVGEMAGADEDFFPEVVGKCD